MRNQPTRTALGQGNGESSITEMPSHHFFHGPSIDGEDMLTQPGDHVIHQAIE